MRFKLIFSIIGFMATILGMGMILPAVVDILYGNDVSAERFFVSAAISVALGALIHVIAGSDNDSLRVKEMFLTTTLVWVSYTLLAAIPFYLSEYNLTLTDSVFEAMSGLTTTGSTILTGLDEMSQGLLLWRSMLQWLGGAGIVIVAIMILPALHIGGMQFFTTESSAHSERDLPTVVQNMRALLIYLIGLTVACALCLKWAGMSWFDAANHALTTISTGGFSTHDASIGYFESPLIEWILIFFMAVSGLPLILGLYLIKRRWKPVKEDEQIVFYLKVIMSSALFLTGLRWLAHHFMPKEVLTYFRESLFAIVSTMTTTGFVVNNYQLWGSFAIAFFMFLLMLGGCTGSTAGGIKMFRFTILFRATAVRLKSLVQPHGVFVPRYGRYMITDDVLISVLVFIGLYLGTAVATTLVLSGYGLDFVTSFSGSLSALSNVGPALGHAIGPDKTFAALPNGAKWILTFAMLVGRLEFVSVFVLFFPFLWRRNA
ncbi:MAG: TrkH family potassium uptake protein [Alphaproteobacteria bacterium]|nr:TrkH family potassium uptake protein [Alphaproteobacteria bacterium]